ncbi:hypothetical protein SBRCBS47491_002233 [Sporothrix bragantina]|uniref:Uncharacterized protein n=1 Tax=Sporothrix bragantina TaxID=671064 RepID=A0ABP0B5A6_9PEZI
MLSSTGSPDSLAARLLASTSVSSSSSSTEPKRHSSPIRSYGAFAFLNFFFHRVTRSGPKLLLYLALLLTTLLVLTRCLPTDLSDSIASSTSHLWEFRPGGGGQGSKKTLYPGENNAHDALAGGGLRIVVFGENDIATSMLPDIADPLNSNNGTSWTRELCIELGCTTYLSYVPVLETPRRSLSSNALYGAATDEVLRDSKEKNAADDFSYVSDEYPIPWEAPDLYTQVARFLEQPAPKRAPKETIFVFTPGMWDVWSLASFPNNKAESYLTSLVFDLFMIIEMLYDAAHDPKSIAYSNYTLSPLDDKALGLGNATAGVTIASRADGYTELGWDDDTAQPFRVVVPFLFDPSLVPGWHLDRPHAPALHTKPEQLRSAVRLTKRWNDYVADEMDKWVKKNATFVHPDDRARLAAEAKAAAEAAEAAAEAAKVAANNEKSDKKVEPPNLSAKFRRDDNSNNNGRPPSPILLRDGIVFRMADYLMDMMIDGQLRTHGINDKKGFGKLPKADSFLEVSKPCVAPESAGLPLDDAKPTAEFRFESDDKKKKGQEEAEQAKTKTTGDADPTHTHVEPGPPTGTEKADDDKPATRFRSKRQESGQNQKDGQASAAENSPASPVPPAIPADVVIPPSSSPAKKLLVCENPDSHLFFTPFSLGQRAIEEVGRIGAAVLRADRSTRNAWEINRKASIEPDREPASWKEYFYRK